MLRIPVPEALVKLRGDAIDGDIPNLCLFATASQRELFVLGSLFYNDGAFKSALFITRIDAEMKAATQTMIAPAFNTTGMFVQEGKPFVTLFDNRVIDQDAISPGPCLRSGNWSIVCTTTAGGASGPCGSSHQGTFVLTRADFEIVRVVMDIAGNASPHPELRGASKSPPIFGSGGLELPHQPWMHSLVDLPGRGALLAVLSGKGSKGWPFAYVVVDDRGEVVRVLDLEGDSPYDKVQITPVVDTFAKRIVIKTARAVHVFDFDGQRIAKVAIDAALAAWRAVAWLDGLVYEPKKRALVRADDVTEIALGLVKSKLKTKTKR
jgi:hypothetical protein